MDIQAEKIELAKLILSTDDTGLISKIKSLFKNRDRNLWSDLSPHVQKGIAESVEQANRGEFITYDKVKSEINTLLKNEA